MTDNTPSRRYRPGEPALIVLSLIGGITCMILAVVYTGEPRLWLTIVGLAALAAGAGTYIVANRRKNLGGRTVPAPATDDVAPALSDAEQLAQAQRVSQVREEWWKLQRSENWIPAYATLSVEDIARDIDEHGGFTVVDGKAVLRPGALDDWRHRNAGDDQH